MLVATLQEIPEISHVARKLYEAQTLWSNKSGAAVAAVI